MNKLFSKKNEKGQGLVEYAIILALVAIVVIGVMRVLGPKIGNTFSMINNSLAMGGETGAPPTDLTCESAIASWEAQVNAPQQAYQAAGYPDSGPVYDAYVASWAWGSGPEKAYGDANGCW